MTNQWVINIIGMLSNDFLNFTRNKIKQKYIKG